jgi:parallel beta-helix repeat protein
LSKGGTDLAPIRFIAEGKAVRITQRNSRTPDGINIEGADHVVVDGFVIDEMPRAGIRLTHSNGSVVRGVRADHNRNWGIFTSFCDDILIEDNVVSSSVKEHGIYVSNSGDRPVIRRNRVFGNRQAGIHINGDQSQGGDGIISRALIECNVIHDNGLGGASGINCDGIQKALIRNNLLYNNHSSGISLYRGDGAAGSIGNRIINNTIIQATKSRWAVNIKNESTNNLVENNILLNKGPRGSINVSMDSLAGLRSDYNVVEDRFSSDDGDRVVNLRRWQTVTRLDGHSLVSASRYLFVDPETADYHLGDDSPAIDAADPLVAPDVDLEGKSRPIGSLPDIGAYEAKPGTASASRSSTSGLSAFLWSVLAVVLVTAILGTWYTRGSVSRWSARTRILMAHAEHFVLARLSRVRFGRTRVSSGDWVPKRPLRKCDFSPSHTPRRGG